MDDSPHYTALSPGGQVESPLSPVRYKSSGSTINVPVVEVGRSKRGIGFIAPLFILGGTLAAAAFAIGHHFFDAHLDGHTVAGEWTQTKSSRVEIFLATAFRTLFCFSAGVSLCQLSWYSLRHEPVTLADIDALVGPPSLMILPRLNLILQTPGVIVMTVIILASPLITILAPALNTRQASVVSRTLSVPTLNTTTDGVLNDIYLASFGGSYGVPTETWDKTALAALISQDPVGWSMPDGCSPECQYNITYAAPAIRCSDLQADQIDDGVNPIYRFVQRVFQDPPSAYLLGYDSQSTGSGYQTSPLNFSVSNDATASAYTWTLAYVPYLASNGDEGALINAAGSVCTFYNATYVASTHYVNGTQSTRVSVSEFHNPLNTTYRNGDNLFAGANLYSPGVGSHVHLLVMADAISAHLEGSLLIDGHFETLATTTLLTETNIFKPYDVDGLSQIHSQIYGLNTTAAVTNVSQALQDLVANVTLGFIHLNTGLTTAMATVASTDIVYVYDQTTLAATYAVAGFLLFVMSGVGMFCLVKNGEASENTFSRLLVAMRNPELDVVADAVDGRRGEHGVDPRRLRLRFGAAVVPGRGEGYVFGLAGQGQTHEGKAE
ncbi:hypothetical protein FB451DRAFT_1292179 [Mycena latifolia]|nr:hypothetical protein FB451DRAFT_1292179 [Mycena latifolia]